MSVVVSVMERTTDHETPIVADNHTLGGAPLRVALVVSTFEYGGLERCLARIVNHIDRSHVTPMVVCLGCAGSASDWIDDPEIPVIALHKRQGNDLGVVWRLARTLKKHNVDLVHSHNWGTLLETVLARRLAGVACHLHVEHGMELDALQSRGWKQRLRNRAMSWGLKQADAVATVSRSVKNRIVEQCRLGADHVMIIPNGVDVLVTQEARERSRSLRRELGISEDACVVGSVGRLAPVKDFGNAIQALSHLLRSGHDAHLLIVGEGAERQRLTELAGAAQVAARTHWVGQQKDVAMWFALMDIYVNCSLSEAMNLGILEAMSAGLPIVVTDVGGSASLVDGTSPCGLVVPSADPLALAAALASLISNGDLRSDMAQCARVRHATQYGTEKMVARYTDLYRRMSRTLVSGCGTQIASSSDETEPG